MHLEHENFVIIISSPSGAGKSTLSKKLLEEDVGVQLSVSATTRSRREGEVDGKHYYFLTKEDFEKQIEESGFVEYAKVFDNYYGTLKSQIKEKMDNNKDVILDIDWQGARLVSNIFDRKKLLKIFILPPSIMELESRLKNRGLDSEEVVEKRMLKAREEISHYNEYDYIIINNEVEDAFLKLKAIVLTKRLENIKQNLLDKFVEEL